MSINDNQEIEFQINVTDQTLLETNGFYEDVKILMENDCNVVDWMLRSDLSIESPLGFAAFILHFNKNQDVKIVEYEPSSNDVFHNIDLQVLSAWLQERGWHIPSPDVDILKRNILFWRHFWESRLILSSYLDDRYGKLEDVSVNEDFDENE